MKVYRTDRAVWAKIQAVLFTFSGFCDIINAIRKLIDKLEFDESIKQTAIQNSILEKGTYK